MDALPRQYTELLQQPERLPSWLVAQLPAHADAPGVTDVLDALERSDLIVDDTEVIGAPTIRDAHWQMRARCQRDDECELDVTFWLQHSDKLEAHLEWTHLTAEDLEASRNSVWSLGTSACLGEQPLAEFHFQASVLSMVVPNAVTCLDIAACWPRPGLWLREVAASRVPPAPDNLFCVHAVHDDPDGAKVWLHTHGLLRCGTYELEMLQIPREDAGIVCGMLNAAAAICIEHGLPEPGEAFEVGADLELVWQPWETAVRRVSRSAQGARSDRDEFHSHPSAVLFAPGRKVLGVFGSQYRNPTCYLPQLQDNPILYVSHLETARMALLARERLDLFVALFDAHHQEDGWAFLMKLGYPIDGAEEDTDREHLWFDVHRATADLIDATLLNEPYSVARMHEGDRGKHNLELMSDWVVVSPFGRFGPDSIMHLRRVLAEKKP